MGTVAKALKKYTDSTGIEQPSSDGSRSDGHNGVCHPERFNSRIKTRVTYSGFSKPQALELFSARLSRLNTFSRSTDFPEEYYYTAAER